MWWECSECGGQIERSRAPVVCSDCGTAGVIFVPIEMSDSLPGEPESEGLREVWLRAGLQLGAAAIARA